ncbi:DEAD/H associated family, partial [mine drainage metagenome]
MLDKIYSGGDISFIFRDAHIVENYFLNKIPKINSDGDLPAFYAHFLTVDPTRNRFNSPFPYTKLDIKQAIEESIRNDVIVSVYMRGTQWTSLQYYNLIRTAFESSITLDNNDKVVMKSCDFKTMKEIKSLSNLEENEVRNSLTRLESAYLVRRKLKDGQVSFIRNNMVSIAEDMDSSIRKLIETLLRSMGPLTLDEIMLRLPIAQEKLQEVLDGMVKDSVLDLEYVTPVFSKQYIMHQDMQALLAGGESDIQASRLLWLEGTALDINEYFEKFGYALDSWSLRARTESYSAERVNELISDKSIYHGRTIRHKPTYAAAWMIEALHSLRYEEPDKNMQGLVAAVRNGASTEDMIQEALGIDRTIIKQMLKNAEFF